MSILLAALVILLFIALRFGLPFALSVASGFIMCRLLDWLDRKNDERKERKQRERSAEGQASK